MQLSRRAVRLNLILCAVMHGLNHFLMIFYKPMYPQMADFFGLSNVADVTTRLTVAYVGYGISNALAGTLSARISLKNLLFFGMLLMSVAVLLFSFIPAASYELAILFAFLIGLGGGTYHPAANTLVTAMHEGKHGKAIGVLSVGSAIGFVAAPLVGTFLGRDGIGFQNLFLLSGLVGVAFSFAFLVFVSEAVHPVRRETRPLLVKKTFPNKVFALIIALVCVPATARDIMNWGYYEVTAYWVAGGFSQGVGVEWVQMMAYLPGPLFQPLAGYLCDRIGALRVVVATFTITAIGYALLAVPSLPVIWVALFLYGTGMSASTVANETFMAALGTARERVIVYAIVLSVALGAGGYLAGASGWIVDLFGKNAITGYQIWFVGMGVLLCASLAAYPVIRLIRNRVQAAASRF